MGKKGIDCRCSNSGIGEDGGESLPKLQIHSGRCKVLRLIVIDIPIGLLTMGPAPVMWRHLVLWAALGEAACFLLPFGPCWTPAHGKRHAVDGRNRKEMLQTGRRHTAQIGDGSRNDVDAATPSARRTSELCFAMMNQGKPMKSNKRTKEGQEERSASCFVDFSNISRQWTVSRGATDIIDAYACLWTARRVACGKVVSLAADTEKWIARD